MKVLNSPVDLIGLKPIDLLPKKINFKLLLLHGMKDTVIPVQSSFNI